MGKHTLYILRHGQYDTSVREPDGGSLTDLGRVQAQYTAEYLKDFPISALHCSTMIRAQESAQIIGERLGLELQASDLLREAMPIIPPRFAAIFFERMENDPTLTHDAIHQDRKRADEAFAAYFTRPKEDEDSHELIVCHGNILRYFACQAIGINVGLWANMNIYHCGLTVIEIASDGLMRLIQHNQTAHMPFDDITDV